MADITLHRLTDQSQWTEEQQPAGPCGVQGPPSYASGTVQETRSVYEANGYTVGCHKDCLATEDPKELDPDTEVIIT